MQYISSVVVAKSVKAMSFKWFKTLLPGLFIMKACHVPADFAIAIIAFNYCNVYISSI